MDSKPSLSSLIGRADLAPSEREIVKHFVETSQFVLPHERVALQVLLNRADAAERMQERSHGIDLGKLTVWMRPEDAYAFTALLSENFFKQHIEANLRADRAESRVAELEGQIAEARGIARSSQNLYHAMHKSGVTMADCEDSCCQLAAYKLADWAAPFRPDTEK